MKEITVSEILEVTAGKLIYGDNSLADVTTVSSVSSNSKELEEGALFLAIKGEKVNAHDYVSSAFEHGAKVALVSEEISADQITEGRMCILVDDTIEAIQALAHWYRNQFSIPVIGITGSVGKTTTKEMVAVALASCKKVLKTEGNMNSQLGVSLMMFRLDDSYDLAVIEMGISEPEEMERLSWIAQPETAIVTNIGVSHIGQLGSKQNIRKEKLDIISHSPDGKGSLFLCGNDELLYNMKEANEKDLSDQAWQVFKHSDVFWYGEECCGSFKAKDVRNQEDQVMFDVVLEDGRCYPVHLGVLGIHNVYNAVAAIAVAYKYGIDLEKAIAALKEYRPIAMRGQIFEVNAITIIDDTYNASPDSMKSALSVLWEKRGSGRKIAVLADVLELGESSEDLHRCVGRYIANKYAQGLRTDVLVTVGEQAEFIAKEACVGGEIIVKSYKKNDSVLNYLKENLKDGDVVMLKGSRGMKLNEIVDELRGE